jgi:uncharacterized RDD family membrane protein YckC
MRTIEIRTTQNVTIEYELATAWQRIVAFVLDLFVFGFGIYLIIIFIILTFSQVLNSADWGFFVVLQLLPFVGLLAYHFLFEIFNKGRSLGKMALGLAVVKIDGSEPGFSEYFLRSVFLLIDAIFSLGVVGSALIASSDKRQRFGDMAANTTVVRRNASTIFSLKDILKIQSLDNYEPQFQEVKKLTDADMLLIKSVVERYQAFPNDGHTEALNELVLKLKNQLNLPDIPRDKVGFLKILIRDYIVLTR